VGVAQRGRLLVAGHFTSGLTDLVGMPPSTYRRREAGDQTDQESRSAAQRAVVSMTAMDITTMTSGATMTASSTQGIKTVLHPVSDLAKARPVYAALLGVQPQADGPYYVGFEAAGQQIGLVPGGGPQGMTSPVAYWHVADIEAKLAEVTAAGATVKQPANDVGGGRLVATFTDPDGNVLGLIQDR
jgi:predicted enzyme related to lactoylglutathione lyase